MTVWRCPDDDERYVLAGHHRLRALRRVKRKTAKVRVQVFEGTLHDARRITVRSNKKAVLTPSNAERQTAAWRLVCMWSAETGYEYSVSETHEDAGIGKGQVSNMRKVREKLHERGENLPETWLAARLAAINGREEEMTDCDWDEILDAQVAELDQKIGSAITEAGHRSPEALARLLAQRLGPRSHTVASFCQTVGVGYAEDDGEDVELADSPF